MNNAEQSAKFDKDGKWIQTEAQIKVSELPRIIHQSVANQFPGFKINEACKVENVQHSNCFQMEIEKDKEQFDVLLKADGEIISKKIEQQDQEDEN